MAKPWAILFSVVSLIGVIGSVSTSGAAAVSATAIVPSGIPTDCSRDVTAELLAWIASVPDGSTLDSAPDACYRVGGILRIRHRSNLTFEGHHATFRAFTKWE